VPLTDASDYEYQKLLIYVGKREQETYEYYDDLAKKLGSSDVGRFFARLAAEELTNKTKSKKNTTNTYCREIELNFC